MSDKKSYNLHELNTWIERIVKSEQKQKILLHGKQLCKLKKNYLIMTVSLFYLSYIDFSILIVVISFKKYFSYFSEVRARYLKREKAERNWELFNLHSRIESIASEIPPHHPYSQRLQILGEIRQVPAPLWIHFLGKMRIMK